MSKGKLGNKVAIVTGGASGIGAGICQEFAQQGARIVIADINQAGAEQVCDEITQGGGSALAVETNVTDPASVGAAVGQVLNRYQTIDILINCVGWNQLKPVEETPPKIGKSSARSISTGRGT